PGTASLLLFGHTIDPLGIRAPTKVGFRAFRSFINGTPYLSNGNPNTDAQRFELFTSHQNIDGETGLITQEPGDQQGDYSSWSAVGPFLNVPNGGMISCTIGFAVGAQTHDQDLKYPQDYANYRARIDRGDDPVAALDDLFSKYPALENA